ncbi:MAG: hypothetical protein WKF94_14150 [Solirubrobacteraceae bacterium]
MMFLLWVVAPLVLLALITGTGLLVERAGGHRLPGPLVLVIGFTGVVCVSQATTRFGATAPLTPFVVVAVAVAGFVVGRRRAPDPWLVALGLGVFLLYGLPAFATGEPTLLGYTNLADAAGHFVIIDQLMGNGYTVENLAPSSLRARVDELFITSYPTGSHTVLGTVRELVRVDVAWLLQPYLAMLAALIAFGLHAVLAPSVRHRALAAGVAGLAACAGLIYAYSVNQQAIKELAGLVCIVALAGVVRPLVLAPLSWRTPIPAAVATAGGIGVLSLALAPWIGPLLLITAGVLYVRSGRRLAALSWQSATFATFALVLSLPALTRAFAFVRTTNVSLTGVELGNLYAPLPFAEALGVWPSGDFRSAIPADRELAWILVGVVALGAVFGLMQVIRRRAWPVLLFAIVSVVGFAAIAGRASPWAYAKALMLLSPVALLLAGFAVVGWWEGRRRAEALALGAALIAGVAWTSALSYHVVDPAPYARFAELEEINERFDGQGPALSTEAEEFAKHFLRDLDLTNSSEGVAQGLVVPNVAVDVGFAVDLDDFSPAVLARDYRLLVVRRGPIASRPASGWERAFNGRYYDVWRRDRDAPRVLAHAPLGGRLDAAAAAPCGQVRRLAGIARVGGGRLAFAARPELAALAPGKATVTVPWPPLGLDPVTLSPVGGPGTVSGKVDIPRTGTQHVWIEASVVRELSVSVDGKLVGVVERELSPHDAATPIGTVSLEAGRHDVELVHGGGGFEPGNGGRNRLIGPVYFTPAADPAGGEVAYVEPADWRSVCGEHADWVEAVA